MYLQSFAAGPIFSMHLDLTFFIWMPLFRLLVTGCYVMTSLIIFSWWEIFYDLFYIIPVTIIVASPTLMLVPLGVEVAKKYNRMYVCMIVATMIPKIFQVVSSLNGNNGSATNTDDHDSGGRVQNLQPHGPPRHNRGRGGGRQRGGRRSNRNNQPTHANDVPPRSVAGGSTPVSGQDEEEEKEVEEEIDYDKIVSLGHPITKDHAALYKKYRAFFTVGEDIVFRSRPTHLQLSEFIEILKFIFEFVSRSRASLLIVFWYFIKNLDDFINSIEKSFDEYTATRLVPPLPLVEAENLNSDGFGAAPGEDEHQYDNSEEMRNTDFDDISDVDSDASYYVRHARFTAEMNGESEGEGEDEVGGVQQDEVVQPTPERVKDSVVSIRETILKFYADYLEHLIPEFYVEGEKIGPYEQNSQFVTDGTSSVPGYSGHVGEWEDIDTKHPLRYPLWRFMRLDRVHSRILSYAELKDRASSLRWDQYRKVTIYPAIATFLLGRFAGRNSKQCDRVIGVMFSNICAELKDPIEKGMFGRDALYNTCILAGQMLSIEAREMEDYSASSEDRSLPEVRF